MQDVTPGERDEGGVASLYIMCDICMLKNMDISGRIHTHMELKNRNRSGKVGELHLSLDTLLCFVC